MIRAILQDARYQLRYPPQRMRRRGHTTGHTDIPQIEEQSRLLLDPLTEHQQRFIEVVGDVYASQPGTWPVFDYVQGMLDMDRIDAIETFESFPTVRVWGMEYSTVWSLGGRRNWPHPDHPIALTVVGIHHCDALRGRFPRATSIPVIDLPKAFFSLVRWAARKRRETHPSPTNVRNVEIQSSAVFDALVNLYRFDQLPPRLLYDLLDKEPPFWGGGSITADGKSWSRPLSRNLFEFEDVEDIETYVERLLLQQPPPFISPESPPSPFDLVATFDYLNAVWELSFGKRLFNFYSAERVARLGYPPQSREEFDARASGLADVLRQANAELDPTPSTDKRRRDKPREHPLIRFESHLVGKLGSSTENRIRSSVSVLEHVLFVREAGQHSAAGRRGAAAMIELGAGYPPVSWETAWSTIEARVIQALGAIREELQAHRSRAAPTPD